MVTIVDWIEANCAEIKRFVELEDVKHLEDDEKEPYKSLYEARSVIELMLKQFDFSDLDSMTMAVRFLLKLRLAANIQIEQRQQAREIFLETVNCIAEHNSIALFKNVDTLKDVEDEEQFCYDILNLLAIYQQALNSLAFSYISMVDSSDNFNLAIKYLHEAEQLYEKYLHLFLPTHKMGRNDRLRFLPDELAWKPPHYFYSMFKLDEYDPEKPFSKMTDNEIDGGVSGKYDWEHSKKINFQNNFTRTIFYLAQVYVNDEAPSSKMLSAYYCFCTLHRQLNCGEYDAVEWSLNAATLSQYFVGEYQFVEARHCICAAEYILSTVYFDHLEKSPRAAATDADGNISVEEEKKRQAWADFRRCWIKLSQTLLEFSWNILDDDYVRRLCSERSYLRDKNFFVPFNLCTSMNEDERIPFGSGITIAPACGDILELGTCTGSFEQARVVFLKGQKYIKEALQYYTMDERCSDAVCLMQDHSLLFRLLSNFELDAHRRCCMHKKRLDMLRPLLEELNQDAWLVVCRQLMFECGEIFILMVDLKLSLITKVDVTSNGYKRMADKVNKLIADGVAMFGRFVRSFHTRDGGLPDQLNADDEKPVLVAWLHMAHLYNKIIKCGDGRQKFEGTVKSLECYRLVEDYCTRNPTAKVQHAAEYAVVEEMIDMLSRRLSHMGKLHTQ